MLLYAVPFGIPFEKAIQIIVSFETIFRMILLSVVIVETPDAPFVKLLLCLDYRPLFGTPVGKPFGKPFGKLFPVSNLIH